jgi:predicted nucleotidyltransferase
MPGRPIETPSFLRYPLSHVLATGSHVKVLRWLVRQGRPLATSQLARLAGLSTQGVRNVLAALTSQGLISTLGEGRAQVHALRQEHPLGPALLALFEAERTRWLALTEGLQRVLRERGGVRAAWVYGSVARSGDQPGSDLDLVVILDDDAPQERASELRDALAEFGRHQDVHLSSVLLSMNDALDPVRSSSPWWKSVVQDAWPLIGPDPLALSSPQLRSRPATIDVAS